MRNKDFIAADSIITFSDTNGKLMALKPDLTSLIVKNYRYIPGYVEKVYYSENIYRASKNHPCVPGDSADRLGMHGGYRYI